MSDNKNLARAEELIENAIGSVVAHITLEHAYYQAPAGSTQKETLGVLIGKMKEDYAAAKNDLLALVAALAGEELDAQEEGE